MKRVLLWTLGGVGALVGAVICIGIAGLVWLASAPVENENKLVAAIRWFSLPDGDLVDVKADGKTLTYVYLVTGNPDHWERRAKSYPVDLCPKPNFQEAVKKGQHYRFVFKDASGVVLGASDVNEQTCAGITAPPKAAS